MPTSYSDDFIDSAADADAGEVGVEIDESHALVCQSVSIKNNHEAVLQ